MTPSRANQIVKDADFQALIAEMRQQYLNDFSNTPPANVDQMVRIRVQLQCLDALMGRLDSLSHDFGRQSNDQPKRSHA